MSHLINVLPLSSSTTASASSRAPKAQSGLHSRPTAKNAIPSRVIGSVLRMRPSETRQTSEALDQTSANNGPAKPSADWSVGGSVASQIRSSLTYSRIIHFGYRWHFCRVATNSTEYSRSLLGRGQDNSATCGYSPLQALSGLTGSGRRHLPMAATALLQEMTGWGSLADICERRLRKTGERQN